ncbi:MAG: peptidoglycan-binding protein [Candidatus Dormibacteria bacterium]
MATRSHRRGTWIGLAVFGVAVATSGWLVTLSRPATSTSGNDPVQQTVMTVEPATLSTTASFSATIGYQPALIKASAVVPGVVTALPAVGSVIDQGQTLFELDGEPTILLYGSVPEWRTLAVGAPPGTDIQELQKNLNQMGYDNGYPLPEDGVFSVSTGYAVQRFLKAKGLAPSTQLTYGTVLFAPGPLFVSGLAVGLGSTVSGGAEILTVTSTQRTVTGSYAGSGLAVGQRASVTPDSGATTVAGTVTALTAQTSNGSSQESVTITVAGSPVLPTGEISAQASVVTASVKNALAVPAQALVALVEGGYALEVPTSRGREHLVAVHVGATGSHNLVQVSGPAVRPGLRVLVPTLF